MAATSMKLRVMSQHVTNKEQIEKLLDGMARLAASSTGAYVTESTQFGELRMRREADVETSE